MSFNEFINDDRTMDAVVRNFEIIGEAASKIPGDFKSDNLQIEWHRITNFRNRIIHSYFDIKYEIIWKIKEEKLPELSESIGDLINNSTFQVCL
jgi:uncharacterized protein with HEPN domain